MLLKYEIFEAFQGRILAHNDFVNIGKLFDPYLNLRCPAVELSTQFFLLTQM